MGNQTEGTEFTESIGEDIDLQGIGEVKAAFKLQDSSLKLRDEMDRKDASSPGRVKARRNFWVLTPDWQRRILNLGEVYALQTGDFRFRI